MADVSQIKLPNGSVYDLIDEKSGYITAEYIENKTDYEIPVSRVGEIVVGETAIGTDSTNFPTSKAVVDYVDERVVQEMDAIDVGVTEIKANGTSLAIENGVVNIPVVGPNQSVGLMTDEYMSRIYNRIPTSTSQLTNDSGFVTSDEKLAVSRNLNNGIVYEVVLGSSSNPINTETKFQSKTFQYSLFDNTASLYIGNNSARGELQLYGPQSNYSTRIRSTTTTNNYTIYLPGKEGTIALTSDIPEDKVFIAKRGTTSYNDVYNALINKKTVFAIDLGIGEQKPLWRASQYDTSETLPFILFERINVSIGVSIKTLKLNSNNTWTEYSYSIPSKTSDLTNDSGYLTASDIASVMTYKGTKANYAALPSTGNTTGDVWHLTDTGAEWAWDGSAWQELGTAIDLSGYATKATTLAGYGITDAKIENGTITLGSNTITPLMSFTETDPTVPSWAKQSSKPSYGLTEISGTDDLRAIEALTGTSGLLKKTAANTWTLDTNTYLTSYTETDPVFSASAAAGITSTDISNWNGKSSTDEKVKAIALPTTSSTYYLVLGSNSGSAETKNYSDKLTFGYSSSQVVLKVGDTTNNQKGRIYLYGSAAAGVTYLDTAATISRTITLPDKTGTIALTSDIPDTSSFLTSETDPVFSASAAAGITATDISNWNAKVSDDKTWNGVSLGVSGTYTAADQYIPVKATNALSGTASQIVVTQTPAQYRIAKYDDNAYLNSTTPSANDNSTKVATTAYVDSAVGGITVPTKTSDLTNDSGFITSYTDEKLATTAITKDGTDKYFVLSSNSDTASTKYRSGDELSFVYYASNVADLTIGKRGIQGGVKIHCGASNDTGYTLIRTISHTSQNTVWLPNNDGNLALISDIPTRYTSSNTTGYLTMADLPIYDGTVV